MRPDGESDPGDPTSPWAGDVPIPAPPTFTWSPSDVAPNSATSPSEHVANDVTSGASHEFGGNGAGSRINGRTLDGDAIVGSRLELSARWRAMSTRTRALSAVGLVVVVALIGTALVAGRGSTNDAEPVAAETGTDDEDDERTNGSDDGTLPDSDSDGRGSEIDDDGANGSPEFGVWTDSVIRLPEQLRTAQAASTVVAVTGDRTVHEIDIPSGRVRSVKVRSLPIDGQVVTAVSATIIVSWDGSGLLLRAGEPPTEVRIGGNRGRMVAVPGRDEFAATLFGDGPDSFEQVRVTADGTTLEVPSPVEFAGGWEMVFGSSGDRLVNDSGGVYRVGDDGTAERISTGTLLSASAPHLIVRECDEAYVCEYVRIDDTTGERRTVDLGESFNAFSLGSPAQVSPDGRSAWYVVFGNSGARDVIVDLETGEETVTASPFIGEPGSMWAADSSGVFLVGTSGEIDFVDRETGRRVSFGDELGRVTVLSVRAGGTPGVVEAPEPTATGLRVAGVDAAGALHVIDIDSGESSTTAEPWSKELGSSPVTVIADSQGVLLASIDGSTTVRVDVDGVASAQGAAPLGSVIAGPIPGTVWRPDSLLTDSAVYELVDAAGRPVGGVIALGIVPDFELLGGDGLGGLVVTSPAGGVFVVTPGGATRLTTGKVVALGSTAAYVRECDDQARCGITRVDRTTGERFPVDAALFDGSVVDELAIPAMGATVSPDGDVVFIGSSAFGTESAIVDVAAQASIEIPGVATHSPIVWTDDSRYALWLCDDVLRLFDRADGSVRTLSGLPTLEAFGVLPVL